MKITKILVLIIMLAAVLSAQEMRLAERIKSVSENLLEDYTQPLITSFGTGVSTGLFHSARSHGFLGFDLGVRGMYIQVPDFAKTFDATVLVCSLSNGDTVSYTQVLDSVSTIFGPKPQTDVPAPGNAVGIPPFIPGGFDLAGVPFLMPQLNVGLLFGSELAIRYIPITFRGSRVNFLGIGLKEHLNSLPFMKGVPLPVDLAIGGAIQNFSVKDSLGYTILSSRTTNLQLIASKNLIVFEPMAGFGLEQTKVHFEYDFEYYAPGDPVPRIDTVDVEINAQNNYRIIVGFTFKLAIFYLHYDYNMMPHYETHNGIIGFSIR